MIDDDDDDDISKKFLTRCSNAFSQKTTGYDGDDTNKTIVK